MSLSPTRPPRVFISYSHDSSEHKDRVLELCDRLRSHGIDSWIDQYEISPPEGWPRWCALQVREADYVLVVCTELYECRFRGLRQPDSGLGVIWEGYVVAQELYDVGARSTKFIPIGYLLENGDQIPDILRGATRYDIGSEEGYWLLYRRLTGQPATTAPPVGELVALPQRERKTSQFSVSPEPCYEDDRAKRLSEALEEAYKRLEEESTSGGDVTSVRQEILHLRREIREGQRLKAGDFMADGRFRLIEPLGRGGFATVWKTYDRKRRELVAVKVLHGQYAEDRTRRERFFRGARKMAELRHPGIAQIIDEQFAEDGHHFFAMEYIEGGDLRRAVIGGQVRREEIRSLILSLGDALSFAHSKGIIHRDVKPANVLLAQRSPKLTDFDLVRALDTTGGTQTHGMMGTFLFAAPEVLDNAKEAGVVADVYSLAMTAVFSYYGKDLPPEVWRRPESFVEELPCSSRIREVLLRGIAWNPEDRFSSVRDFCDEFGEASLHTRCRQGAAGWEAEPGEERVNEKDGMILVFVPGGEYFLGAADLSPESAPAHRVVLSPFWIGKYPVTNDQYARFLQENKRIQEPAFWRNERFNREQQPVVGVNWDDAKAYCLWAGLMLPSEAQWEAAARGKDRRPFPWGFQEPTEEYANFLKLGGETTPVGAYPKGVGPYGTFDQAGNVWEWCHDIWSEQAYLGRQGKKDPVYLLGDAGARVVRGGSWFFSSKYLKTALRSQRRSSDRLINHLGFRCCLPVAR